MSQTRARLMFIGAVVIYGTIGLFVRFINADSAVIVLIRGVVGSLSIALVLLFKRQALDINGIRANAFWLLGTGVCLGLNWVALFAAYRYTSVAVASVCNYTAPILLVLLAPVLFSEKITPFKRACVVVALIGIVFVSGLIGTDTAQIDVLGVGLGMLSAVAFVGIVVCNRFVKDMDPLSQVFVQLAVAAVVVFVYVLISKGGVPLPTDIVSLILSLLLGIVHTGFAYVLWFGAQPHLPLHEVALLGYIEPVMNVVLSALVLGEPLSALGMMGAALVLGAAAASEVFDDTSRSAATKLSIKED